MRSDILDFGVMNKTKEGCIHKGSGSLFFNYQAKNFWI